MTQTKKCSRTLKVRDDTPLIFRTFSWLCQSAATFTNRVFCEYRLLGCYTTYSQIFGYAERIKVLNISAYCRWGILSSHLCFCLLSQEKTMFGPHWIKCTLLLDGWDTSVREKYDSVQRWLNLLPTNTLALMRELKENSGRFVVCCGRCASIKACQQRSSRWFNYR